MSDKKASPTGRLVSSEPRLQPFPIRSKLGAEIKRIFAPKPGEVFIPINYSEIELRLLAHLEKEKDEPEGSVPPKAP